MKFILLNRSVKWPSRTSRSPASPSVNRPTPSTSGQRRFARAKKEVLRFAEQGFSLIN